MQKFTRPLTREIDLAGERLALTFSEKGISVRPVGSRRPPREMSWPALLSTVARGGEEPDANAVAAAVETLRGGSTRNKPAPVPAAEQKTGSIPALLQRFEVWLTAHRPRYARALAPGASAAELDGLQTALGKPLPDELRVLLAWHNGQSDDFVGFFEGNWALMSAAQIAAAKRQLDADAAGGWQPVWLPFLAENSGGYLCLDTSQTPAPVREFWPGNETHAVVAPSLAVWLDDFITAAERGAYTEDPERGAFVRERMQ